MNLNTIIRVHYDELVLKGKTVRYNFIKQLKKNIIQSLAEFNNLKYHLYYQHIEISNFNETDWESIKNKLSKVFGISNFSLVYKLPKDVSKVEALIIKFIKTYPAIKTFKLFVNRSDKSFNMSSKEITERIAKIILSNSTLKVDVHQPELKIYLEVHQKSIFYYTNKIEGAKGLPVGVSGKVILLLSGGIDSPVAAWQLMKRGLEVIFLHFATPPVTSEKAIEKVKTLVKILKPYNSNKAQLYLCNFLSLQNELMHISLPSYRITLMRRMFLQIANHLANDLKISAIATGDALGQVASQTLASMNVITQVSQLLILRPLITFDKREIMNVAKSINTYETSILPFDDCCSLFVPKNPVTQPNITTTRSLENELEQMINLKALIKITATQITEVVI